MAFLPFGAGPRHCVGMRLALLQAKLAMTRLLKKFRILKSDDTQVPLTTMETATIVPKDGIRIVLERR